MKIRELAILLEPMPTACIRIQSAHVHSSSMYALFIHQPILRRRGAYYPGARTRPREREIQIITIISLWNIQRKGKARIAGDESRCWSCVYSCCCGEEGWYDVSFVFRA